MLLPGAAPVAAFVFGVVVVSICLILAFFMGILARHAAEYIVKDTQAYRIYEAGAINAYRWWFNFSAWAGSFMIGSFIVFVYTAIGPYIYFINWLTRTS